MITLHPYNQAERTIEFHDLGENHYYNYIVYLYTGRDGNQIKKRRAVFSYGLVRRLEELVPQMSEDEQQAFAKCLYSLFVNNRPITDGLTHIHHLHTQGYPLAAEGIDLCADFFKQYVTEHNLEEMEAIVSFFKQQG